MLARFRASSPDRCPQAAKFLCHAFGTRRGWWEKRKLFEAANKTAPPCETGTGNKYLATVPGEQLQWISCCFTWNIALRETDFQRPAKGGSTPAFAYQHAAIAPLPCLNLQPWFSWFNLFEWDSFKKCNCSRENRLQNLICSANVGYSPTPRQHFWKIAGSKNFLFDASFEKK